jgi:hypothetical protein
MSERPVEERTPWHFRLLVGAAALYLLLRFGQGVAWVVDRV